jgi:hypothetical protein
MAGDSLGCTMLGDEVPVIAGTPAVSSRNSRRLRLMLMINPQVAMFG